MENEKDMEKLMELLMLAAGNAHRVDKPIKEAEYSEENLPRLTERERRALRKLPKDIVSAVNRLSQSLLTERVPACSQEAAADMLFRGQVDCDEDLRNKLRAQEDAELDRQEQSHDEENE